MFSNVFWTFLNQHLSEFTFHHFEPCFVQGSDKMATFCSAYFLFPLKVQPQRAGRPVLFLIFKCSPFSSCCMEVHHSESFRLFSQTPFCVESTLQVTLRRSRFENGGTFLTSHFGLMFKGENYLYMKHGWVEARKHYPECLAKTVVPIWRRHIYVLIIREMCQIFKMADGDCGESCTVGNVRFNDFGSCQYRGNF